MAQAEESPADFFAAAAGEAGGALGLADGGARRRARAAGAAQAGGRGHQVGALLPSARALPSSYHVGGVVRGLRSECCGSVRWPGGGRGHEVGALRSLCPSVSLSYHAEGCTRAVERVRRARALAWGRARPPAPSCARPRRRSRRRGRRRARWGSTSAPTGCRPRPEPALDTPGSGACYERAAGRAQVVSAVSPAAARDHPAVVPGMRLLAVQVAHPRLRLVLLCKPRIHAHPPPPRPLRQAPHTTPFAMTRENQAL